MIRVKTISWKIICKYSYKYWRLALLCFPNVYNYKNHQKHKCKQYYSNYSKCIINWVRSLRALEVWHTLILFTVDDCSRCSQIFVVPVLSLDWKHVLINVIAQSSGFIRSFDCQWRIGCLSPEPRVDADLLAAKSNSVVNAVGSLGWIPDKRVSARRTCHTFIILHLLARHSISKWHRYQVAESVCTVEPVDFCVV